MALPARWPLVLLAALSGVVTELRLELGAVRSDDCCIADDCCCAADENGCCEAAPAGGPRWMARCACGSHGDTRVLALGRTDWLPAAEARALAPRVPRADHLRLAEWTRPRSRSRAPEPPPPRS